MQHANLKSRHSPIIRDADPGDHDGMRDLYIATWTATYAATLGKVVLAAMLEDLQHSGMRCMLPGQGERAAVAVVAGAVAGSVIVVERNGIAYLWGMYVHPGSQRRGLGALLLRHAAGWLTEGAVVEARVMPSSPWAIAFYTRHGFVETGREQLEVAPGHHTEAILMRVSRSGLSVRVS